MQSHHEFEKAQKSFVQFCRTIAALRHPQTGCPWDLEQTHQTLRKYMIEEAYEAAEAMETTDYKEICAELGDVLLQVVLNAQVAADNGHFTIDDVIQSIDEKMRRRHPHVFGNEQERQAREVSQIKKKWHEIKAQEKIANQTQEQEYLFEKEKIQKVFPATRKAFEIGKIAHRIKFDWPDFNPVLTQLSSEFEELKIEVAKKNNAKNIQEELGDVYFSLAQLCRHLGFDPELVAEDGNKKFLNRFKMMEQLAAEDRLNILGMSQDMMEEYWKKAKAKEKLKDS